MDLLQLKRRLRRLDLLDYAMIKVDCIIVGIIIAVYISSLRGFVEQNIWVVIFLVIVIGLRPLVKYFKS